MGKNTRELLKGVTTVNGYRNRLHKVLALPENQRSQSNGPLMRCAPLALIWNNDVIIKDVNITNPNPVNIDAETVYIAALRLALQGTTGAQILPIIKGLATTTEVQQIILAVENKQGRDLTGKTKGWVLNALWCALTAMISFSDFSSAMRWIITSQPGSDSDTNAAIAGALLGTIFGYDVLQSDPVTAYNTQVVINVNTATGGNPRQPMYTVADFHQLAHNACEVAKIL